MLLPAQSRLSDQLTRASQVEQLKKKKGKKPIAVKKDDDEASEVPSSTLEDQAQAGASETGAPPGQIEALDPILSDNEKAIEDEKTADVSPTDTPSLAQQSKMRSTSFRTGTAGPPSPGPSGPDGDTAPEIYRKQVSRIEELEKENKKLLKDSTEAEKRWQKAEDELAVLREGDVESSSKNIAGGEVEKLVGSVLLLNYGDFMS